MQKKAKCALMAHFYVILLLVQYLLPTFACNLYLYLIT